MRPMPQIVLAETIKSLCSWRCGKCDAAGRLDPALPRRPKIASIPSLSLAARQPAKPSICSLEPKIEREKSQSLLTGRTLLD